MLVLKSVNSTECALNLEVFSDELSEAQKLRKQKADDELKKVTSVIDQLVKQAGCQVVYQGELCTAYQISEPLPVAAGIVLFFLIFCF